jgi:hypothetical protein
LIKRICCIVVYFISLNFGGCPSLFIGLGDETNILFIDSVPHEIIFIRISLESGSESSISITSLDELVV